MSDSIFPPARLPGNDWPKLLPGWVWLCGAGPGDAGLLTLHALNALRQAEVIVHDALVAPEILDFAPPEALRIYAGKRGGKPSADQRDISLTLVAQARAGKRVVRLKGGDPFVFGRGAEEAEVLLDHAVPFRVIPGISAGLGGLACAGIALTARDVNQSVTILTGHDKRGETPPLDWGAVSRASPVLVIYMGMKHIGRIMAALAAAGRPADEPVSVITNATTPREQVLETTLGRAEADVARAGMVPPAIICVGARPIPGARGPRTP